MFRLNLWRYKKLQENSAEAEDDSDIMGMMATDNNNNDATDGDDNNSNSSQLKNSKSPKVSDSFSFHLNNVSVIFRFIPISTFLTSC